ncbi:ankyrin repeat domain-containing protein [bacterium]|nr:ankyrin repeat domain-containing protein [bacterium]
MGPLFEAIQTGRDLRELLHAGHSPNVYEDFEGISWTPLHLATYRCLAQMAEYLLDAWASPNCQTLAARGPGPYQHLVGLTPLDLAISLDDEALVGLLVRRGARPAQVHRFTPQLRHELAKARAVAAAEGLVVEPILLPLVETAQQLGDWDEADRLLQSIMAHEGEGERTLHRRIRGLLARGKVDEAMEEASLVFVTYRSQGDYQSALQVLRDMRLIKASSARPYELEIEYLSSLGWMAAAEACQQQLLELHRQQGRRHEVDASRARFEILRRRPENRSLSRPPLAWTAPEPAENGNSGNLPALLEEEPETRQPWWKLWWD